MRVVQRAAQPPPVSVHSNALVICQKKTPPPLPSPPPPKDDPPLTPEDEAALGTGLGIGIFALLLLIGYIIFQQRRARAMKARLAAEMDGEMLEVQGLMGQDVRVAGAAPFAIRAPVGGAMRTAAMLESDRMDNKI